MQVDCYLLTTLIFSDNKLAMRLIFVQGKLYLRVKRDDEKAQQVVN